ncbi:MAG: VacJ family lipoprotein [Alphaproteobacteria bacterium]
MESVFLKGRGTCFAVAMALVLATAGCATPPPAGDPEAMAEFIALNDPIEPANRALFDVHQVIDDFVLIPAATAYRTVVPEAPRRGIHNALNNLREPVFLANDLLQGEFVQASIAFTRFCVNSTVGLLGLFDVAAELGLPRHKEDFGQTLAVWGMGEGPYVFLPVVGPSNPRDIVGRLVDVVMDPFFWVARATDHEELQSVQLGLTILDERTQLLDTLEDVRRTSVDYYARLREMYRQRRDKQIHNSGSASPYVSISVTVSDTASTVTQQELSR